MAGNNHNLDLVNINAYIKFDEILSICSQDNENEIMMSIKGHNSVTNLRKKITGNNTNLDLVSINANDIQSLVKICPFFPKILRGYEILTSIKGHNSLTNVQKKDV